MSDTSKSESLDEDVMFDDEVAPAEAELGTIVDPGDESGVDDEKEMVAFEIRDDDPSGVDVATQDQGEVQSAEEAAMHIEE
jgi:hypothetical protein